MRVLLILLLLLLSGCAHYHYEGVGNFAEAHNDCLLKTKAYMGKQDNFDMGYGMREKEFMTECMQGQGFTLVKDQRN